MSQELPFFHLPLQLTGNRVYHIERDDNRQLKRGYMSVIYKVRAMPGNEPLALKTLWRLKDASDEEQRLWQTAAAQFTHEISTLQQLQDIPGIVQVLDRGIHDEVPWYIMEYVDGPDIVSGLTGKNRRQQVRIFGEAMKALAEAHKKGIAHLDLKPSNILLRHAQDPLILDFGVSRVVQLGWDTVNVTTGMSGTPRYMAPEQFLPATAMSDWQQADLWALGVLLCEILLGRHPLGIMPDDDYETIVGKIMNAPLPDLTDALGDSYLAQVCTRALARNTSERYANVWEILDDLARWESAQFSRCLNDCRVALAQSDFATARRQAVAAHLWSPYEPQVKECLKQALSAQYRTPVSVDWHARLSADLVMFWQIAKDLTLPAGIARIFEANDNDPCFIVVETARGIPLQQFLRQRGEREDADVLDYEEALALWRLLRECALYALDKRLPLVGFAPTNVYCEFDKKRWRVTAFSLWGIGWRGTATPDAIVAARDILLSFLHSATLALPVELEALETATGVEQIDEALHHWGEGS